MALTSAIVKQRLAAVPAVQMDNEAQRIISTASSADLSSLDAEGVLRLYEALARQVPRIYSSNDAAAMKRLTGLTQFQPVTATPDYGVDLVKRASVGSPAIQTQLSASVLTRLYAAERRRLSRLERAGIDGDTIGRGQLGQPAYDDVKSPTHYLAPWKVCLTRVYLSELLKTAPLATCKFDLSAYHVKVPPNYGNDVIRNPVLEDFVVAAYLGIRIKVATKPGRSPKDTLRFAVALYHGMRSMVVTAQTAAKQDVHWAPVEAELLRAGHTDEVNYVREVVL